jgi:hypothetical protein
MTSTAFEAWVAKARAVPIEEEMERRGITLRGNIDRCGPCPRCGGEDRFSINIREQCWNCRRCKTKQDKGDVVGFVEWFDGVDFITAATTLAGEPPPNTKPNGHDGTKSRKVVVATFAYEDAAGQLAFVVERVEYQSADGSFILTESGKRKKKFRQKRPDPDKAGRWIWNVDGVPAILYRLPQLIEAVSLGHTIYVAEGEAKVELLRRWNVSATCCAGGAEKWLPEHSDYLRGADAVILPDNDDSGRKHRDVIGASLQNVAASVRVLDLPGLPLKGDVIDWAKLGGTVEQLYELTERAAKPWVPGHHSADEQPPENSDAQPKFTLIPFEQLRATKHTSYLVKGLIPRRALIVVWGPPKCFKSFWVFDLSMSIARNVYYQNRTVKGGTVVYCAFEGADGFRKRADAYRQKWLREIEVTIPFFLMGTRTDLVRDHLDREHQDAD